MAVKLTERLRRWRQVISTRPIAEGPEALGGRQAEQFLTTLVQSHRNFAGAGLYPNKRVPAGRRRREIDLIVVTAKRIHIIEIKNWSGSLRIVAGRWVQTTRDGRQIDHPDLVAHNQDKALALMEYLRGQGVKLDPGAWETFLSNKVIFINPRLAVPDRAIADHSDVLIADRLDSYLGRQRRAGFGERVLGSVVGWCLETESARAVMGKAFGSLAPDQVAAVRAAIDRLPTWDTLQSFGGRIETGDLLRASIGGAIVTRDQIGGPCSCRVRWTRNKAWGLVKALTGFGQLGRLDLPDGPRPITPEDFVTFHRVGEPGPAHVPLLGLDRLTLG